MSAYTLLQILVREVVFARHIVLYSLQATDLFVSGTCRPPSCHQLSPANCVRTGWAGVMEGIHGLPAGK